MAPFENSERLTGLKIGDSDRLKMLKKVMAFGYALGKPHMQSTAGVVSGRIAKPSRLQIDVAVNPQLGGPLLDEDGHVVGIVTPGMSNAQNINYAVPFVESLIVAKRIDRHSQAQTQLSIQPSSEGRFAVWPHHLPRLNCRFTRANAVLMSLMKSACNSGVAAPACTRRSTRCRRRTSCAR